MLRHSLPRSSTLRKVHVCVVGAGVSGLRCADVLLERGFEVTIFEARNRIGGRVAQSDHLGHTVDLGANWIHGTNGNPILNLAKDVDAVLCSDWGKTSMFDEHGTTVSASKAAQVSETFWEIIADAFKYSNEASSIPSNRSLKDFCEEKLDAKGLGASDRRIMLQMADTWGAFVGDPVEKQSLKYFWLEECIDGENVFVASTYTSILERISKPAIEKATLLLSTRAVSITSMAPQSGNPRVSVKTDKGTFEFDEVVVTIPLGCLKKEQIAFSPPFSSRMTRAIKALSYGRLEKVYITFERAFWHSSPDESPFFVHFLQPTYADSNPRHWGIEMVSLASMTPTSAAHPTLLFYIQGPCAEHITNLITNLSPASPDYLSRLRDFLQPYYSRLPHYAPTAACQPIRALATDWQHDPLAGFGSYINFQVSEAASEGAEEQKLDEDIETLREGVPERAIWLAGEHVAPFVALGTVTGAWWSGESVARRIATLHGKDIVETLAESKQADLQI